MNKLIAWSGPAAGLAQAVAALLYLAVFIVMFILVLNPLVNKLAMTNPDGMWNISTTLIYLATLVAGGLITALITLGYPLWLSSHGQTKGALITISWTALWLVVIVSILLLVLMI